MSLGTSQQNTNIHFLLICLLDIVFFKFSDEYKMPRSKAGKKRNCPNPAHMKAAVLEVIQKQLSLRKASLKYGVSKSAINRSVKKFAAATEGENVSFEYQPHYDTHRVFSAEQEQKLSDYLVTAAKHNYGLTTVEMRKLAYKYSSLNKIDVPAWEKQKMAGKGWLRMFRSRHKNISLRKPEATSLARATAFNRQNVLEFFTKYDTVLKRNKYEPQQIWNVDETGLSTVQNVPKILAPKGIKQLASMTSAERGTNVTMIGGVNGAGNSVPPLFVFPRVHFKPHMLKGAPPGSVGAANPSGWSNENIFISYMEHFIHHVQPGPNNPQILILDNHESHYSPEIIRKCKEHHISVVTLPPHCSHKMQPLDKSVYGPFKSFYNRAMNDWMNSPGNAGKPVSIYEVAELAGVAYELAFTIKNITSGFRSTGIAPFNSNIFQDSDFLAASVTDRPQPLQEENNVLATNDSIDDNDGDVLKEAGSSKKDNSVDLISADASHASSSKLETSKAFTPEMLRPFPKAAPRKTINRRRVGKSRIITDTPEEIEIRKSKESKRRTSTKQMIMKKKSVKKQIFQDSDSSEENEEMEVSFHESSDSDYVNEIEALEREKENLEMLDRQNLAVGDYLLAQCKGEKNKEHYVAKILKNTSGIFEVEFLKKMSKTDTFIVDTDNSDSYTLESDDIVMKLPQPESVGTTKRSACHLKFGVDFSNYLMR